MKRYAAIFIALLTCVAARAGGWSDPLTIDRVFTENTDIIAIYTTGGGVYTPGCTQNAFIFRATNDAQRARAYATLLTAFAAGRKVQLWFQDACTTWSYHDVTSVMITSAP